MLPSILFSYSLTQKTNSTHRKRDSSLYGYYSQYEDSTAKISNDYYGNTAQSAFGIFRKNCALFLSLFLEIHNPIRFAHMYKFA